MSNPEQPKAEEFTKEAKKFLDTFDVLETVMGLYKIRETIEQVCKLIVQRDATIDSLVKEKHTLYGDGYGFLATDADGGQVWVNSTSIALEQKDEEIANLQEQLIKMCRVFHSIDCVCKWCNIAKERAVAGT